MRSIPRYYVKGKGAFTYDVICERSLAMQLLHLSNKEKSPIRESTDAADREVPALDNIIPNSPTLPYDMKHVIQ